MMHYDFKSKGLLPFVRVELVQWLACLPFVQTVRVRIPLMYKGLFVEHEL